MPRTPDRSTSTTRTTARDRRETDFREDIAKLDVPLLVIQGDADRILPYEKTGARLPALVEDMQLVTIEGGPHAIAWTHTLQVNGALLDFVGAESPVKAS